MRQHILHGPSARVDIGGAHDGLVHRRLDASLGSQEGRGSPRRRST
jgi:hypothetical protein